MPIDNRRVTCDICGVQQWEERFGVGWPDWIIVNGIGAVSPKANEPIANRHIEMYICSVHKTAISKFLNTLQRQHR